MSTDWIKCFAPGDMANPYYLRKLPSFFSTFDANNPTPDINHTLQLFNVKRLMNLKIKPDDISDDIYTTFTSTSNTFKGYIGKFLSTIDDNNLIDTFRLVELDYIDDFFTIFNDYKLTNRISDSVFLALLNEDHANIPTILRNKRIVERYNSILTNYICSDCSHAEFLIDFHLAKDNLHNKAYFVPKDLTAFKQLEIIERYVDSCDCNPNYLRLLSTAKSTATFPISNELRYKAAKRNETVCNQLFTNSNGVTYGAEVMFSDSTEDISVDMSNPLMPRFTYSKSWIKENLDFPTLLNNLIHLFGFTDGFCNSTFVSHRYELSVFEGTLGLKGKTDYIEGVAFTQRNLLSSLQINAYLRELSQYGINLESIIEWFFSQYLPEEFDANGFVFSPSSAGTSYQEKCRNLLIEMDGILKQFNMFVTSGSIDRGFFEFASEPMLFSHIKSFNSEKYGYITDAELQTISYLFFSDQSRIRYVKGFEANYSDFISMIIKENLTLSDFLPYQTAAIEALIDGDFLQINSNGYIKPNESKVIVLKLFYKNEVLRTDFHQDNEFFNSLLQNGKIQTERTLFSRPEQDYLDYMLNMHNFTNGPDLRNKYCHGNNPIDEAQSELNYYHILKIVCLVVIKINDEFCKYK